MFAYPKKELKNLHRTRQEKVWTLSYIRFSRIWLKDVEFLSRKVSVSNFVILDFRNTMNFSKLL